MTKIVAKLSLLLISLSIVIFYINTIIVFIICLFFDKCYDIHETCLDVVCYSIVNESKLSINSHVTTYFFDSNILPIPLINKDYVLFDDDTAFCVIHNTDGSFELITRINPETNNISSRVRIKNMDTYYLPCKVDMR